MRVLFVAPQPFFIPRGTPIAVANLLRALEGEVEGKLLTLPFGDELELGFQVERMEKIPFTRVPPPGFSFTKVLYDLQLMEEVLRQARGYDLIHAVEEANFIALMAKKLRGIPFLYDMDSVISHQLKGPLKKMAERVEEKALREAMAVVAVSPSLVDHARRFNKRVFYLPDTPFWQDYPRVEKKELGWEGKTVILYAGNFAPYQGVDFLVESFSLTKREDLLLVLVGGEKEFNLPRVEVIPPVSPREVNRYLSAADILVSPRLTGVNTPMKIYSYLGAAKPIIASAIESHTQVLSPEVAVLLPLNKELWAKKMEELASRPELRKELGRRARALFEREYSWGRFRQRAREIYREIKSALYLEEK